MSHIVQMSSLKGSYPDLSFIQSLDERRKKVESFIERFKAGHWSEIRLNRVEKSRVTVNLSLAFLCLLLQSPVQTLSTQEAAKLSLSKQIARKTGFYLNVYGGCILAAPALLGGIIGGASYYLGVNQLNYDPVKMAVLVGVAGSITAIASNLLGFYITGTLPNSSSEAENAEQNMWDDYTLLKTKPAAYQLLEWNGPQMKAGETVLEFETRRYLAKALVEKLNLSELVTYFKSISTQHEKIDIAFRYLQQAADILEIQTRIESGDRTYTIDLSQLGFAAFRLGYGQPTLALTS